MEDEKKRRRARHRNEETGQVLEGNREGEWSHTAGASVE
jgi:hypothetical protein